MYTADYLIQTADGTTVPLLFNSYMFRKYSEAKGMELDELINGIEAGHTLKLNDLHLLLLIAHHTHQVYNKLPMDATEVDAFLWVDALGGFNSVKLIDVYKLFMVKLLNVDPAQVQAMYDGALEAVDKKKEAKGTRLKATG